jgi:hypothetical protein
MTVGNKSMSAEDGSNTPTENHCDNCGLTSRLASAFRTVAGPRRSRRRLCPPCYTKAKSAECIWSAIGYVVLGLVGLCLLGLGHYPLGSPAPLVVGLLMLPIAAPVFTLAHELGHACAAWCLGMRVYQISVGILGTPVYERRLFGCTWTVTNIPAGGFTLVVNRGATWARLRHWLVDLAGPMVNAGLVAASSSSPGIGSATDLDGAVLHAVFWINVAFLVTALWPRRVFTSMGWTRSDGLDLLTLPFISEAETRLWILGYFFYEGTDRLQQRQYVEAEALFRRGLEIDPNYVHLRYGLGLAFSLTRRFAEARDLYATLLKSADSDEFRAILLNNLAWEALHIGGAENLAEADRLSAEAMEWVPWRPYIKGTRGSVLVEIGRTQEGKVLLQQAMDQHIESWSKALNACYLAIAEAKDGDIDAADRWLAEARLYDPDCLLLGKADAFVSGCKH